MSDQDGRRPRPGAGVRAELAESRTGWTLTLFTDAGAVDAVQAAAGLLAPGPLTVSVRPNLVPGEPFEISVVRVAVDPDARAAKENSAADRAEVLPVVRGAVSRSRSAGRVGENGRVVGQVH